jgi:hypothetical protein
VVEGRRAIAVPVSRAISDSRGGQFCPLVTVIILPHGGRPASSAKARHRTSAPISSRSRPIVSDDKLLVSTECPCRRLSTCWATVADRNRLFLLALAQRRAKPTLYPDTPAHLTRSLKLQTACCALGAALNSKKLFVSKHQSCNTCDNFERFELHLPVFASLLRRCRTLTWLAWRPWADLSAEHPCQ